MGSEKSDRLLRLANRLYYIAGWFFLVAGAVLVILEPLPTGTDALTNYWYDLLERWGVPLLGLAILVWFHYPRKWLRGTLIGLSLFYLATMFVLSLFDPNETLSFACPR